MGEYAGAVTAADFGDVRAEFAALISACGVYDLGWRGKIAVTGGDRMRWLNGMLTNSVRDLAVGRGTYAFLLNPQGRILGDLYAYNRGESLLLDTDCAQVAKLLEVFDHYIIMDDVAIANLGEQLTALGVAGPKAREALRSAGMDLPELQPLQFADVGSMTVARNDNANVEGYELWLDPAKASSLWETLTKAAALPVGSAAIELLRIASGIPRYGQDIRERDLPQETEQQRALNFNKGCYIGQEIVERIRSRGAVHRMFTGFEVEGPLPTPGAKIQSEGKDVGEITSSASLPVLGGERSVALGYIRREVASPDRQVQSGDTKLRVAHLPFTEVFKH